MNFKRLFRKKTLFYVVILFGIIGIIGLELILWITPLGAGVSPDSITYLAGAKSLLSGNGYIQNSSPIIHWPPLFPITLAAVGLLENNLVQAARFLNAILFGVNAGLFALSIYLTTGRKILTAICAVLFFFSTASLLVLHSFAWSEPLFISLLLGCMILLCMYVRRPTLFLFVSSSFCLGLALLARYTGIGFIPAALVMVFFGPGGHQLRRRFREVVIWLALAITPLAIFFIRNLLLVGSPTDRGIASHPISPSTYITTLIRIAGDYFASISLPHLVKPAILGLVAVLLIVQLILLFMRHGREMNWRSPEILMAFCGLLFSISYLLFLFISISFLDASTPMDARILAPVLIIMTVGVFAVVWFITQKMKQPVEWMAFLVLVTLCTAIKLPGAIHFAIDSQKNGLEYDSRQWQDSESITFVKSLVEDTKIYTNDIYAINFLTGKQSLPLPTQMVQYTLAINSNYHAEIATICKDITENRALLVCFDPNKWPDNQNCPEVESTCQLPILQNLADGTIYGEKNK